MLRRVPVACLLLLALGVVGPGSAAAAEPLPGPAAASHDYAIPNGWFYPQAGGGSGAGYALTNDGGVAFWRDYQRLGGPITLGYPSSWRWVGPDGFIYQATQAGLLQWQPDEQRAVLANTFDLLSNASRDEWLKTRSVPPPVADDGSKGDPTRAAAIRLSWLEDEGIRNRYFANPNPGEIAEWSQQRAIELYGLPTSKPERRGPLVVQRFQRITFQRWIEAVPGMPAPGTVTRVLGGDLLKEAGLLPAISLTPARSDSAEARIDPELRSRLALLAELPVARPLYEVAVQQPLAIVWAPMPADVGALYSARRRWLAVNVRWRDADPKSAATLLSHELSHARDFAANRPIWTSAGCFETEQVAFKTQASVWEAFYGPGGKTGEIGEIDRQQNYVLGALRRDPDAFAARIVQVYQHECSDARR